MKWLLRISGALLLCAVLASVGAWIAFPWYAQALIDRAVAGRGIVLKLNDSGRPGISGLRFARLDAAITMPPDSCTGIVATYRASISNGRLSWHPLAARNGLSARITLDADSVEVLQKPANILFRDAHPKVRARLDLSGDKHRFFALSPDSVACNVDGGRIETGTLRLDGVSYRALLTRSNNWVQQPSRFMAASLFSEGVRTPLTGFEATFGMAREQGKPCTLIFRECSVELFGIRASTPRIEYSLRKRQTNFVLQLDRLPLDRLAGVMASGIVNPALSGNMSGSLPVEYLDSTLKITNGTFDTDPGSTLVFRGEEGSPLLSVDTGRRKNAPRFIDGLNAEVTLDARGGRFSGIRLGSFSSRVFGGLVTSTPALWEQGQGTTDCTIRLEEVPILDRIRLHGPFSGTLKGSISGTIPLSIRGGHFAVQGAKLSSKGGGTLIQTTRQTPETGQPIFAGRTTTTSWSFSEPSVLLDSDTEGRTRIGFSLKSLTRRSGGGEMALSGARGVLSLPEDWQHPSTVTMSAFSAGLFDGRISIDHVDYDLRKKHAETIVQVSGIPLQKLLELQGTSKIQATGTIRGRLPVVLDGESFSIPDGLMDAERSGKIIYSSTPEERATANAGMRMTYEALGNFHYASLLSSITMTTDGNSRIALQLKGYNPEFQNGRPVNLNLNIEQNLLDLFRSLSISSGIEEVLLEKAARKGK